jgi:hypothetical protein
MPIDFGLSKVTNTQLHRIRANPLGQGLLEQNVIEQYITF